MSKRSRMLDYHIPRSYQTNHDRAHRSRRKNLIFCIYTSCSHPTFAQFDLHLQHLPHKLLLELPNLPLKKLNLLPTIQTLPIIKPQTTDDPLPRLLHLLRQILHHLPLPQRLL